MGVLISSRRLKQGSFSKLYRGHTSASGILIAMQSDNSLFKPLFLDIGIMNASSGITMISIDEFRSNRFVNEGRMAEQFVGQHLLFLTEGTRPALHYWLREGKSNNAEVDYILQLESDIVPVEVKAGKAGTLKSLLRFMAEKSSRLAVRFDLSTPSSFSIDFSMPGPDPGKRAQGALISLPLYLAGQVHRIISRYFQHNQG
jgi:hypothetical protein